MKSILFIVLVWALAMSANGVVYECDGTQADFNLKYASVVDGNDDVIELPSGTFEWNELARPVITKSCTIKGEGIGNTIIIDGYTDNTSQLSVIHLACTTGKLRMTGIEFRPDSPLVDNGFTAGVVSVGGCSELEIDNCKWASGLGRRSFFPFGNGSDVVGVMHNCIFAQSNQLFFQRAKADWGDTGWSVEPPKGQIGMFYIEDVTTEGTNTNSNNFDGDGGSWAVVRFSQIHNSKFTFHGTESSQRPRGGRWMEFYGNRVTGTAGDNIAVDFRSGAGYVFNNDVAATRTRLIKVNNYRHGDRFKPWGIADGTNPWDHNVTDDDETTPGGAGDGVYESGTFDAAGYRTGSDDSKTWTPNQWAGYSVRWLHYSGTATSGGINSLTVSPDPGWIPNAFGGLMCRKVGTNDYSVVSSNTTNTITMVGPDYYDVTYSAGNAFEIFAAARIESNTADGDLGWTGTFGFSGAGFFTAAAGMAYEIRKVIALDQVGMGVSDDLVGTTSLVPVNPNQVVGGEPVREWGNIHSGTPYSATAQIVADRDYFAEVASFIADGGNSGNGVGTFAQMDAITPSLTGVAFWVTDQGSWNTTFSGTIAATSVEAGYICEIVSVGTTDWTLVGAASNTVGVTFKATGVGTGTGTVRPMQGRLYEWDGADWVFEYEPLTYPHPGRSDADPDVIPPQVVSATINGATLTIQWNETITGGAAAQFALSAGTLSAYAGSGSTRTMTVTPAATNDDPTYTLNWTPGDIEDSANNPMEALSGFVVTNVTPPPPTDPVPFNPGRRRGTKGGFQGR